MKILEMNQEIDKNTPKKKSQSKRRREKGIVIILLMIFLLILIYTWYPAILRSFEEEEKVEHKIYEINSDDDFKKYSSIKGEGSLSDPYILEDIKFKTHLSGIIIRNTKAHFIIKECKFTGDKEPYITIRYSSNITINNNHFSESSQVYQAIFAEESNELEISENSFNNISKCIELRNCYNCHIKNNNIFNSSDAISLSILSKSYNDINVIENNTITNSRDGFVISGGAYQYVGPEKLIIKNNRIINTSFNSFMNIEEIVMTNNIFLDSRDFIFKGISIFNCINNEFRLVEHPIYYAISQRITLDYCSNMNFESNYIYSDSDCLYLTQKIVSLNITKNRFQGVTGLNISQPPRNEYVEFQDVMIIENDFNCSNNVLFNSTNIKGAPQFGDGSMGNYWNDYQGSDNDGDGIGDTPYLIASDIQDNYPLMNPP